MANVVILSKRVERFLAKSADKKLKKRLEDKIQALAYHPQISNAEKIQGSDVSYRVRVSDYRILYDYAAGIVTVLDIGHRREIYR